MPPGICVKLDKYPMTRRNLSVLAGGGSSQPTSVEHHMLDRPSRRPSKAQPRTETGLANAAVQQRLVAVRSFHEYLVQDGLREQNPVRRGQAGRSGRRPRQGLVRHIEQAPWIPNEDVWQRILAACTAESLRNRLRVTLAYDGALRREELVQLDVEDFEPAHRLIHLWAEATKSQRAREVAFGTTSSQLFAACPRERRTLFGRIDGPLFRSMSNRNWVAPLGASSWSKTVEGIARRAGAPNSPD